MKKELERREYLFDISAEETGREGIRTITGRPIVYNSRTNIGYFDEIIMPGALDNADLTDVRFLVNHNIDMIPLARSRRNNENSTLRLDPNMYGLDMAADVDEANNQTARALVSAVDRGDISGMSFMFSVGADEWEGLDTDHPLRRITEIASVVEVSAVTFPAYSDTSIGVRAAEALENAKALLESKRSEATETLEKVDECRNQLDLLKEKTKILSRG